MMPNTSNYIIVVHRHEEHILVAAHSNSNPENLFEFEVPRIVSSNPLALRYIPESQLVGCRTNITMEGDDTTLYCHHHLPDWLSLLQVPSNKNLLSICLFDDVPKELQQISTYVLATLMTYMIEKTISYFGESCNANIQIHFINTSSDNVSAYDKNINAANAFLKNTYNVRSGLLPLSSILENQLEEIGIGTPLNTPYHVYLVNDLHIAQLEKNSNKSLSVFYSALGEEPIKYHNLSKNIKGIIAKHVGFSEMDFGKNTIAQVVRSGRITYPSIGLDIDVSNELFDVYKKISDSLTPLFIANSKKTESFLHRSVVVNIGNLTAPFADFFAKKLDSAKKTELGTNAVDVSFISINHQQIASCGLNTIIKKQ